MKNLNFAFLEQTDNYPAFDCKPNGIIIEIEREPFNCLPLLFCFWHSQCSAIINLWILKEKQRTQGYLSTLEENGQGWSKQREREGLDMMELFKMRVMESDFCFVFLLLLCIH